MAVRKDRYSGHCLFVDALRDVLGLAPLYSSDRATYTPETYSLSQTVFDEEDGVDPDGTKSRSMWQWKRRDSGSDPA